MIYTHIYDILLKLATMFLLIIFLIQIPFLEGHGIVIMLLGITLYFFVYNFIVRTLASYLYCRLTLGMHITIGQAKKLNNAFSPISPLKREWLPMRELKDLKTENKYQIALDNFENWEIANKLHREQQILDFKNNSQRTKLLKIIMNVLIGYFLIAGFMDWPPVSYVSWAFCVVFDTNKFYPIVSSLLLVIPTIILFKALDKNIK